MRWRVLWRGTLVGLLVLGGCAAGTRTSAPRDADELRATVRAVYEAVERGDEGEYRRLVEMSPHDAYSDALTATMFESIRLHQAVERFGVREDAARLGSPKASGADTAAAVGKAIASSRRSSTRPATRPGVSLAAVDYRINARAMIAAVESWTFTVRGDRATIDQFADHPGAPALKRVAGRWVLAPTPWDAARDTATYRLAVESERALAAALAAAREAVVNGSAKSIEDVNSILRGLLSEPTTEPTTRP